MRRSSGGHDGVNQQMYYQHQYMPNPDPQAQLAAQKQQHRAQQQHAQRAKNAHSQQQQHQQQQGQPGDDQWSTSYKLHFSYNKQDESGGQGAAPSALYMAAKPTTDKAVGQSANIQKMTLASTGGGGQQNPPKNQRPSSATARIRSAVDNSQKYAVKDPKDMSTSAQTTMSAAQTRELNTDTQEDGAEGTGAVNTEEGRQMLQRDDEEEMDGKRLDNNSAHPEVSTTTPSQSVELQSVGNVDVRNSSIGSLGEDLVDVGISTVPNQFCSCKDALDLRKLLLLSKGSRGGVVPSSTAVMDMYMVGKVVGVGSYGKVRAAWHRLTGSKVAIKTYDKSKLKDPAHWKRVHSEIKIMEQVSHPRIARMYEAVETPKRMHLIMECLDGGNLCSYVKAKRRLSEDESRRIFFQILQAVEHLHMLGVTHRDIKLENVLFADDRDIKLIDFGFSTVCQPGKRLKVFCGTPSYMAPEIVRRTEYEGKPVDMWSLGILLYALLCGCFPFRAKSYPDLYRRIARGTFAIPEELSASVKDLLRQFLTVDVSQRITAQAALRHSWLQAQFATTPDINKLRLETPILISDKPSDDIDEATLAELDKFGLGKDDVVRLILTKTHSSIASFYYLLLDLNLTKRRVLMAKRGMSGGFSKGRNSSSVGNDPYLVQQQQLQQSAGGGQGGFMRPKSASASRQSSNNPQRPLSAFSSRR
jgi:serine/threonine protein kinase